MTTEAIRWWRERLVLDPLLIETTVELMTALEASGEIAVAVQQARIHEALMHQELEAPPDPRITRIADRLRSQLNAEIVPAAPQSTKTPPEPLPLRTAAHPRRRVA